MPDTLINRVIPVRQQTRQNWWTRQVAFGNEGRFFVCANGGGRFNIPHVDVPATNLATNYVQAI